MTIRSLASRIARWLAACSLLVATGAGLGCGGGNNGGNDAGGNGSGSADAGSSNAGGGAACSPDAGTCQLPSDFSFESQYEMRFTKFQFTEDSPGSSLVNPLIEQFLEQKREYPVVVLMHLRKLDAEAGTVEIRGGAGLKVDKGCKPSDQEGGCEYEWEDDASSTYYDIQLDGETGRLQGGLDELDFVATVKQEGGGTRKFTIPIKGLELKQTYLQPDGEGGVAISGGRLSGYVTKEDAENTTAPQVEIKLSKVFENDTGPNFDSNGDGTKDAWKLSATFSAGEAQIAR
jgi:hypothetical protein